MRTIFSSASVGITSDGEDPKAGGMAHDYIIDVNYPPGTPAHEIARVQFQHGPIREVGVNGIQHADLYRILIDRLECAQAGPFACVENAQQIEHLRAALDIDEARTRRRTLAGTEGLSKETNTIHIDKEAIHSILAAYGWVAEYEPASPDDEPVRFVYGSTGFRGRDSILTLHYGQMALSEHPTLDLSVYGVAGTITSVDLVTTPIEEIPDAVARFACTNLTDLVAYSATALRCAHALPATPIKPASIESTTDPDSEQQDGE